MTACVALCIPRSYFWDLATLNRVVELEHVDKQSVYCGVAMCGHTRGEGARVKSEPIPSRGQERRKEWAGQGQPNLPDAGRVV
mgnify:CR=1 FL=1